MYDEPLANFVLNGEEIKVIDSMVGDNVYPNQAGYITTVDKDYIGIMCQDREIEILKIKPAGKKEMRVRDWLNGKKKEELIGLKVNEEN